jgi:long-chain acyl-CoA synthetase
LRLWLSNLSPKTGRRTDWGSVEGLSRRILAFIKHCRSAIANYKLPRSVEFRSEPLPLSGAGKVLKRTLREPYWKDTERQVN